MMKTYTGDNYHTITIIKSAALRTSTSFWTAAVKTVLNITKVVSQYYIIRHGGAEHFFKLCILYCVCTQSTHSQCSLTFPGQITEYTEGQMMHKVISGHRHRGRSAGIGIPASCFTARYWSILKKKQDGAAWHSHFLGALRHSRRVLTFWTPGIPGALISFLNLTREPMKKSAAILSKKMAFDMANRMQVVWNIYTFHRNGKRQYAIY